MNDPFWVEVHRLLPDVDLVAVPPAAAVVRSTLADSDEAERLRASAEATIRWLWPATLPTPTVLHPHWRRVGEDLLRLELECGHTEVPADRATEAIRATWERVREAGGVIDERRWTHAGGLRLAAELDGCWMDLYYAEGAEVLTATVSVAPITVTGELAEELTAASIEKPWTVADR